MFGNNCGNNERRGRCRSNCIPVPSVIDNCGCGCNNNCCGCNKGGCNCKSNKSWKCVCSCTCSVKSDECNRRRCKCGCNR